MCVRRSAGPTTTLRTTAIPTGRGSLPSPSSHFQIRAALRAPLPLRHRLDPRIPARPSPDGPALPPQAPLPASYVARNSPVTSADLASVFRYVVTSLPCCVVTSPQAAARPQLRQKAATTSSVLL